MLKQGVTILLLFFIYGDIFAQDRDSIIWGAETNGVRMGLLLYRETATSAKRQECLIMTCALHPQEKGITRHDMMFPLENEGFEVSIKDEFGHDLKKTARGKAQGKKIETLDSLKIKRRLVVHVGNEPQQAYAFHIDDFFKIELLGHYEVEVRLKLLKITGEKHHKIVTFPPLKFKTVLIPTKDD